MSGGLGQQSREALDANFGGQGHVPTPEQHAGWGEPWRRLSTGRVAPQAAARWARRGGRALEAAAVRRAEGGCGLNCGGAICWLCRAPYDWEVDQRSVGPA